GPSPGSLDPPVLLQPHQCRIESALVEVEQLLGDLLETRGNLVGVLWAHRRERPQNDEIKRPLQQLDSFFFFIRHPSGLSKRDYYFPLVCQVDLSRKWPAEENPAGAGCRGFGKRTIRTPARNGFWEN